MFAPKLVTDSGSSQFIITGGNLILTMAVLALFVLGWCRAVESESPGSEERKTPDTPRLPPATVAGEILTDWFSHQKSFHKQLSTQERSVVTLVLTGKTYKEVADELEISESSIKTYMKRVYEKTGVSNREELINLLTSNSYGSREER